MLMYAAPWIALFLVIFLAVKVGNYYDDKAKCYCSIIIDDCEYYECLYNQTDNTKYRQDYSLCLLEELKKINKIKMDAV